MPQPRSGAWTRWSIAWGPARGQLLWSQYIATKKATADKFGLLWNSGDDLQTPQQGRPTGSDESTSFLLVSLQHQCDWHLHPPGLEGHGAFSFICDEQVLLPCNHKRFGSWSPIHGDADIPHYERHILARLFCDLWQALVQWNYPNQQCLPLHDSHAVVHIYHAPKTYFHFALSYGGKLLACKSLPAARCSDWEALLLRAWHCPDWCTFHLNRRWCDRRLWCRHQVPLFRGPSVEVFSGQDWQQSEDHGSSQGCQEWRRRGGRATTIKCHLEGQQPWSEQSLSGRTCSGSVCIQTIALGAGAWLTSVGPRSFDIPTLQSFGAERLKWNCERHRGWRIGVCISFFSTFAFCTPDRWVQVLGFNYTCRQTLVWNLYSAEKFLSSQVLDSAVYVPHTLTVRSATFKAEVWNERCCWNRIACFYSNLAWWQSHFIAKMQWNSTGWTET